MEVRRLDLEDSNKVMRGGRFTGWLWELAGLVEEPEKERETGDERETKKESGRE